jgi:hypothetical protein
MTGAQATVTSINLNILPPANAITVNINYTNPVMNVTFQDGYFPGQTYWYSANIGAMSTYIGAGTAAWVGFAGASGGNSVCAVRAPCYMLKSYLS